MAISPINLARVSQNMRTNFVLAAVTRTQQQMLLAEAQISSGRSFVTASEDPLGASRAVDLSLALAQQSQFRSNLRQGDDNLTASDRAITEINSLLIDASAIASQMVSNLTSADEREAQAELIAGIRQQLQLVGNRQFNGRFIFAGRDTMSQPFVDANGGVAYVGDIGDRLTRVEQRIFSPVNVTGDLLFGALSDAIRSDVVLTPQLTDAVRLDDVSSAIGGTITRGLLVINEINGAGPVTVDLSAAETMGDVVTLINDAATAAGADFEAALTDTGLTVTPSGGEITITDASGGVVARDLGIRTSTPTTSMVEGATLTPRITRLTPIEDLAGGAGINLDDGLILSNGPTTVKVDLSQAETVQDVLNILNNAGASILARINDAGTGIEVLNQVSGSTLGIGENGGTTASELGIRTFNSATSLSSLNFGRGVNLADSADDLRITIRSGGMVDVDLDGAETIGDVITLINDAATGAGVSVTASFTTTGNGIRIVDGTTGTGTLSVTGLNGSAAAIELGLQNAPSGTGGSEIIGDDVNQVRANGILDALIDLERALRADDTQEITLAAQRLDELRNEVTRVHGVIGARSQAMTSKRLQIEDAALTTETFLSQVRDLDYADAATRLQTASTQLQASLQATSLTLNLTLLDFLR